MAPPGSRQEGKLVVCLYKMLTTCLTVLIFGSGNYWAKLCMSLQLRQLLSVLFLYYLVLLRVFSCAL